MRRWKAHKSHRTDQNHIGTAHDDEWDRFDWMRWKTRTWTRRWMTGMIGLRMQIAVNQLFA